MKTRIIKHCWIFSHLQLRHIQIVRLKFRKCLQSFYLPGIFRHVILWNEVKTLVTQLCLILCDPMDYRPPGSSVHGINSPGKNTGAGSYSLLQGIFLTQGSNSGLLHCRQILYLLSQGKLINRSRGTLIIYKTKIGSHHLETSQNIFLYLKIVPSSWPFNDC